MNQYCDEDCQAVCDFCKNYQDDGKGTGIFEAEGMCLATGKRVDASDDCKENFICFRITEGEVTNDTVL